MKTVDDFFISQKDIENIESLMFIKGDKDGAWNTTKEKLQERIENAKNLIEEYC